MGDKKKLETSLGWNFDSSLRRRCELGRPWTTILFDWMHVFFVQGVFQRHLHCLVSAAHEFGFAEVTYKKMYDFALVWKMAGKVGSKANHPAEALSPARSAASWEAKTFKCTASEGLGLLPISERPKPITIRPSGHCLWL